MNRFRKHIALFFIISTFGCKSVEKKLTIQTNESTKVDLAQNFKKYVLEQKEEFRSIFKSDTLKFTNYSIESIIEKLDYDSEYKNIYITKYWMLYNYKKMIPKLIERVTDTTEIGLIHYADLIIPERIENGDMEFSGHGPIIGDDLFKLSGRANYLLTEITGQNFGIVSMNSPKKELLKIQADWNKWYSEIKNYW